MNLQVVLVTASPFVRAGRQGPRRIGAAGRGGLRERQRERRLATDATVKRARHSQWEGRTGGEGAAGQVRLRPPASSGWRAGPTRREDGCKNEGGSRPVGQLLAAST